MGLAAVLLLMLAAALVALPIILASPLLLAITDRALPPIPVIGGRLARAVRSVVDTATHALYAYLADQLGALAEMFYAMGVAAWRLWDAMFGYTNSLHAQAKNLLTTNQSLYNGSINWTNASEAFLKSQLQGNINLTWNHADALYRESVGVTENYYNQAIWHADANHQASTTALNGAIAGVTDQLNGDYQSLTAAMGQLYDQSIAHTTQAQQALLGQIGIAGQRALAQAQAAQAAATAAAHAIAGTVTGQAVSGLDAAAHDVVIGPWQALLPQLEVIGNAIGSEAATATGVAGVLAPAVPATVAGVLGALAPAIAAIGTEVAQCTVPMCENLGGMSSMLGSLADLGLIGAILALAAESLHDPSAATATVRSVVLTPAEDMVSTVRSLVGI